jgi:uncharacterized SAM-binding protein YcdF (DUF218 family)
MITWPRWYRGGQNARRGGIFFSLLVLLFWIALLVVVYLLRYPLMRFAGNFWVVDESPQASDVIVMLGDDNYAGDRAARAAELFKAGRAPRVVASGRYLRPYASIAQFEEHDLADRGVPASAILRLAHRAQNTHEEAIAISQLLSSRGWRRVLLVTSNYHTRRSRYICVREFPAGTVVRVVAARDSDYDPDRWWATRAGIKIFLGESAGMLAAMWEMRHKNVQAEGSGLFAGPQPSPDPPFTVGRSRIQSRFTRQSWLYYSFFTWHLRPGVFGKGGFRVA